MEDFTSLIKGKIEALRPKLQDTSRRNPLINNVLTAKSSAFVRIVDEKPQSILDGFLSTEKADLRLIPLPPTDIDPPDEDTSKFRSEVQTAQVTDSEYLADIEKLDFENDKHAIDKQEKALRELKDRLRVQLGMPPRPRAEQFADLNNHALAHGINPDSSLPAPDAEAVDDRFQDDNLQTLLLPKTFQSRMARILSKARSYQEERGLDVVYLVLGYLKWTLPNAAKGDEFKSPLLLLPANLERTRSKEGEVYRVSRRGDPLLNPSLMHKLWTEANLDLSDIRGMVTAEEVDVEKLFSRLADLSPANMRWSVQREASFGIYPFQGIELYNDLDTSDCDFSKFPIVSQLLIGKSEQDRAGLSSFSEADVESDLGKKLVPHIVLDADSSQFIALLRVANSENVALEGPPGSGKSQTIVNAIANAVHAGKKVLFVAQKATALEVVYSRLQALNLEKFVLPLLGGGSNEEFFQSLADRILSEPLELQRDSAALAARYATLRSRLASYIDVLTKPIEGTGMSVHQAMGLAIRYKQPVNDLPPDFGVIKIDIARYTKTFLPSDLSRLVAAVAELVSRLQESRLPTDSVWQEATADAVNIDNIHSLLLSASSTILAVQGLVASADASDSALLDEYLDQPFSRIQQDINRLAENRITKEVHNLACRIGLRALHSSLDTFVQADSQIERLCKDFGFSLSDFQLVSSSASELQELRSFVVESDISRIEEKTVSEALAKLTEDESLLTRALECRDALFAIIPGKPSRRQVLACKGLLSKRAMLSDLQLFIKETGLAEAIADVSRGVAFYQRAQEIIAKAVVPEPSVISKLHATLADGGVLSFLKSGVRRAKRDALSLLVGLPEKASTTVVMAKLEEALELAKELNRLPVSSHLDAFKEGSSQLFKDARASLMELQEVSAAAMLSPEQVIILCGSSVLAAVEELDSKGVSEDLTWGDIEAKRAQIERQREELQGIAEALERAIQVAVALGKRSATEVLSLAKLSQEASTLSSQRQASLESLDPQIKVEDARGLLDGVSQYSDLSASSKKVIFEEDRKEVLETVSANLSLFAAIEDHFKTLSREKSGAEDEASELGINDMMRVLKEHHNDQQGLRCLLARQSIYEESVAIGCAELVKMLDSYKGPLATEDLIVGVCVANLKRVVEQAHGATLLEFDGTSLDVARLQLQELDRQLISRSSAAIDSEALSRANPPEGIARGRKSEYTEMSLIYHELQKSRRIPPRKVVERARGALLELFPCWMMVPTAVPQYLPRKELFDLIIIDEASQMTPENSISALMRGRTALIAGDTNQLPPTSFFKGVGGEEEDDEDISISEESILELANIQFRPKHRLLWHYRSRHEDLIAFSNHYVYDSELVIFPSPTPTTSGLGISLVEVKGVFQRGINPEEAQVMVDAIAQFMRDQPDRSLGVAVMNQSQMEQIDALILRESEINQAVANYLEHWSSTKEGLERFFVKNLENVQGDERDVIFVGTVYGKDPEGKFYQRFGPINGAAGKRRLNVLFSRAKEQIVTFSSIPLSDFSPAEHNEGATLLKRWLEFSATKRLGEVVGVTGRAGYPESPFEEHVIETIESLGYEAIPQVGVSSYFIDVGVKHSSYPYGYICGVECDGATYHSSKSARDRDRLREEVLKRLGWDLYRVWSTDWFRDTLSERDHLKRYLDERLASLTQDASLSSEVVAG